MGPNTCYCDKHRVSRWSNRSGVRQVKLVVAQFVWCIVCSNARPERGGGCAADCIDFWPASVLAKQNLFRRPLNWIELAANGGARSDWFSTRLRIRECTRKSGTKRHNWKYEE